MGPRKTMGPRNPKLALALAILCLTSVAAVGGPWAASLGDAGSEPSYAWLSQAELEQFDAFEVYWLGSDFDGLELYATVRQVEPAAAGLRGRNSVDFLYGDCDATAGSCPFPLEVQVWPACLRNRSSYELTPGVPYPHEEVRVRGVPAALFDGGQRLELYTGAVTVVLFGDSAERLHEAARALRGVGALAAAGDGSAAGDRLAPPVDGALEGTLACDGA